MKSTRLLSVVFSLIMFTGVTAGNTAFAESDDDLDNILKDFCDFDVDPDTFFEQNNDLAPFRDEIILICEGDESERDIAIDEFLSDYFPEAIEEDDEVIEDFEGCIEADGTIGENPNECTIGDMVFVNDEDDDDDDHDKVLVCHKDKTLSIDEHAIRAHLGHGDFEGSCDDDVRDYVDFAEQDLDDLLDDYCELTKTEQEKLLENHPRLAEFSDRLANYCDLSEDEQDVIDELIEEHGDKIRHELRDYKDDYGVDHEKDMRVMLDSYCEMSDEDKVAHVAEHDKAEDHVNKMNQFCALTNEDSRRDFILEHKGEYMEHMKDKMHDMKSDHMDYDRLCALSETNRSSEISDVAKLDRISDWCKMTPAEREDYKKEHHGDEKHDMKMDDKKHDMKMDDKKHDMKMDKMSDMAKDRMSDVAKDKHHEKVKFSDKSDRLKAMIMDKRDISDDRHDEIKMKFEAKHGEDSDKKRSEIKMKYKDHMLKMKFKMSDERKSDVHDRVAEMKAYKAELREKSPNMTDEEKQQLREEFIEKAKDMQLAWITPRTQMTAGIDAAEVECREGYSLVMKASNGVAMCLKAETALTMIDRGIVVPAN